MAGRLPKRASGRILEADRQACEGNSRREERRSHQSQTDRLPRRHISHVGLLRLPHRVLSRYVKVLGGRGGRDGGDREGWGVGGRGVW